MKRSLAIGYEGSAYPVGSVDSAVRPSDAAAGKLPVGPRCSLSKDIWLGQVATADPPGCGMGDYLQSTIASGTSYVVPAGGGVITMWQSRGRSTFTGSGRLQVWRAALDGGFTLVGRSSVETFTANMAPLYSTQIPVVAGDTIGLRLNLDQSGCKFSTGDNGDLFLLDPAPDPAVGGHPELQHPGAQ